MKSSATEPPASDEFEVSIFGPGRGESVVVHLGAGRWMVVDSCRDQHTGEVSALAYLRRIGVDPKSQVHAVVATHAHDDHFDGIADVVQACDRALIVTSSAMVTHEFYALMTADVEVAGVSGTSAYSEYHRMFQIAEQRGGRNRPKPLRRALEGRDLLTLGTSGPVPAVRVTALSPSDKAITRAINSFTEALPQVGGEQSRRATAKANETSIVLWVQAGSARVLLAADMETSPADCGWRAVLDSFAPDVPASLYKAAHHGAKSSHHDGIYSRLLQPQPVMLLAPFRRGSTNLPTAEDIKRLLGHSNRVYTTSPRTPTPSKTVKQEKKRLGSLPYNVREQNGVVGHVRARMPLAGGDWQVDTFRPADRLKPRHARAA